MSKKLSVGGQAVIEGVMMRGPGKIAVAVRQPDGEIAVDVKPSTSIGDRYPEIGDRCVGKNERAYQEQNQRYSP